jgi:hypothetical protein
MPTLKEQILEAARKRPGLTDREITDRIRGRREAQQPINQACRQMETAGRLQRRHRHDGLIGNYPTGVEPRREKIASSPTTAKPRLDLETDTLSEDAVKKILVDWLERHGWSAEVAWGHTRGADCVATRGEEQWIIEVKGCGSRQPMRVNYFLAVLGELLQRMNDPKARYSIALPNMKQFRGLWERLPRLAKERTKVTAIFVGADGQVRVES